MIISIARNNTLTEYTLLHNGEKLKRAYHNNDVEIWSAEEFVFQNGTLASGIINGGFTLSDGYLHLGVGADNNDEADASATIQNIDFTNYSKLDIVVDYKNYVNYGDSSVAYGIDNCWTTALPFSDNETITTTITLDISTYTGTHYIGFGVWAENKSSEPTWHADANVWIKEIKLYN